jgi:phosphate:Na+ symporter
MNLAAILGGLGGGLALFLFGLGLLTETLKQLAGPGMKELLARMTRNRVLGAVTGAVVTAVIQSSSVTTVLVVGFISAGLLNLTQAIGVIMGANIGSTVMAQIIAFKVTAWALPIIMLGFVMREGAKREAPKQVGTMLLGLGLVFLGMGSMSAAAQPLRSYQPFLETLAAMDNAFLGILAGALFTAVVQSSAATTGIAIAFAGQGLITLDAGIAIAFGANIGTCATAMLACIGRPPTAKQAAWAHLLFNIIGVFLWVAFIPQLAGLVRWLSPTSADAATDAPRQIANAHTIFNVINTMLFLPFANQLATIVRRIVPDAPPTEKVESRFIAEGLLVTPSLALDAAHRELGHIGQRELILVESIGEVERLDELEKLAFDVEEVQGLLTNFLSSLSHESLSEAESDRLQDTMVVAEYLESATDIVHGSMLPALREFMRLPGAEKFMESGPLTHFSDAVVEQFQQTLLAMMDWDAQLAERVISEKSAVQRLADESRMELRRLLQTRGQSAAEVYRLSSRLVEHLQRLYYLSKRIAKRVVQSQGRMAA